MGGGFPTPQSAPSFAAFTGHDGAKEKASSFCRGRQYYTNPQHGHWHLPRSEEVGAGRHLWMTGSISVKGTLIDKYAFQKKKFGFVGAGDLAWLEG